MIYSVVVSLDSEFKSYNLDTEKPFNSGEDIKTPAGTRRIVDVRAKATQQDGMVFVVMVQKGY